MAKSRSVATLTALLLLPCCAWPSPDRQLLIDYFEACRVYDTTVLARLATAPCNPTTDGVVQDFRIAGMEDVGGADNGRTRELTLDARMRLPDGAVSPQRLTVRLERVEGRWMVSSVTRLPVSQTSPAASSAPPN